MPSRTQVCDRGKFTIVQISLKSHRNDEFQNAKQVKGLQDYHLLKRKYDQEGISQLQMQMLKAFSHQRK
jgi:hypothetical protein